MSHRIQEEAEKLADVLNETLGRNVQMRACWSCGHEMHFHDPEGCAFVTLVSKPEVHPVCACGIAGIKGAYEQ